MSIHELPSGERVHVHPPTRRFPNGKKVLVRDHANSPLRKRMMAKLDENIARKQELRDEHARRLQAKRDRLAAHPAVPPEKRHC